MSLETISYKTVVIGEHTGYGNASRLLTKSLEGRGVSLHPDSDVQLNFCMPPDYIFKDHGLTIGYTPWESTEVPENWVAGLRAVDDLWVTSDFVKDVFQKHRLNRQHDIFVLPHGIEECWKPVEHRREDRPFTFVHVGEPAVRKGGDIVLRAWHKAFKDRKDVRLIMKCNKYPAARVKDISGSIVMSPGMYDNIDVVGNIMTQQEMWNMYARSDCMVYPTRGEGFGLIPWEAMATGLPTIIPEQGCAMVMNQFATGLLRNSQWVNSTATHEHPGQWLDPDVNEVIAQMEYVMSDYDAIGTARYWGAQKLHTDYSWDSIARLAISRINLLRD